MSLIQIERPIHEMFLKNQEDYSSLIHKIDRHNGIVTLHPFLSESSYLHPTAQLIGAIYVAENCFICPYAVIRADEDCSLKGVYIGEDTNIQDHVVIHDQGNVIGSHVNLAHHSIIHGSTIRDHTTIYIGSIIDHAEVGEHCFIDAKCYIRDVTIPSYSYIPPGTMITHPRDLNKIESIKHNHRLKHKLVQSLNHQHLTMYKKL